jgi:hypothetical protein
MGATPRHPYPKWVYSPTGGWWSQPKNWATNTAVVAGTMTIIVAMLWRYSDKKMEEYDRSLELPYKKSSK